MSQVYDNVKPYSWNQTALNRGGFFFEKLTLALTLYRRNIYI